MKLLVIHSRDLEKGSTKFRFVQFQDYFREQGIETDYVRYRDIDQAWLEKLPHYDVVVNQKCLMKMRLAQKIRELSRRVVFDFDDAIWTRPGKPYGLITHWRVRHRLHYWLKLADRVTTASNFLAAYAKQQTSRVTVIPMAIDMQQWQPGERKGNDCTIGWVGSPATLKNLERIEAVLQQTLQRFAEARLAVFCGKRPSLSLDYDYTGYQPGAEAGFIRGLDIGLLPLPREEYAMGKSPIKAIQYLACGVPVVGDIIGASGEFLGKDNSISVKTDAEWLEALEVLIHNVTLRRQMGQRGMQDVHRKFDATIVRQQLVELLRDTSG